MQIELALPLTLAVMDGMIVRVAQETYVMPISAIVECIRPSRTDIRPLVGTCGALQVRGSIVPLVYLGDVFDVPGFVREPAECTVIVIEGSDRARIGLVVDELCGHQQVVVKSIEESYGSVPGIAGATILGNGRGRLHRRHRKAVGPARQGFSSILRRPPAAKLKTAA